MNARKIIYSLSALLLFLWISTPFQVYAETRNIYVGDIITLQIETRKFSADELRIKFQDFEILEIKDESGGYLISMRTFDVGERKIPLGDKEIIIKVQSTLDDIDREDIFEGEAQVIKAGFPFYWRILFYFFAGIFILSGVFFLLRIILKRKKKLQSPYQLFLRCSNALSADDNNYFVDLTYYFKKYLESLYQFRIIGKTSAEIINELKEIQALEAMLPEIQKWLTECDRFKFTGVDVLREEKQEHYAGLIQLVEKIDMQKEETT